MSMVDYRENLNPQELAKFNRLASDWWDVNGPFRPLHTMNPLRMNYFHSFTDFVGKRVLDVGCGGGIAAEAMTRLGAQVVGIDQAENVLHIAHKHATDNQLDIAYHQQGVEQHAEKNAGKYDIVTCLEMLEHVPDPQSVIQACSRTLKPGGWIFFSTINRSPKSFLFAIIGAEYILRILPKGTHSYAAFIRPTELVTWAENCELQIKDTTGLLYNPFTKRFTTGTDVSVNYFVAAQKG